MAEWFMWFMESWWSTGLACVCVVGLAGVGMYYAWKVDQLQRKDDAPTLYEALRKDRNKP